MSKEYPKLKIPIHNCPDNEDIVKFFRELLSHEAFYGCPEKDRNRMVKYVIFAYDPESPCVKNFSSDLKKRKEAAAEAAGYVRLTSGKFEQPVIDYMNMLNAHINDMICCYLRYFVNNQIWSLIVADENVMAEYISLLLEPINNQNGGKMDDKKLLEAATIKSKLREECKSIVADLNKLYKELYGDNDDLKEIITKPIRPETIGQ